MSTVGKAGLEDVVVSTSDICYIDGHEGRLLYRGYDVDDLAAHSTFEEVAYLLWHGALPTKKEFDTFNKALSSTANRKVPPKLLALLRTLPEEDLADGGAAHRRLRAVGLGSRCRRQFAGGDAAQVHPAHRPDADAGGGVGADAARQVAGRAQSQAQPGRATSST